MITKKRFYEYATYDDDGFISGVREEAPEEIKKEYENFMKERAEAIKNGFK